MKPYTDSPQYDESRNRFEHPAGYRNDKGLKEFDPAPTANPK